MRLVKRTMSVILLSCLMLMSIFMQAAYAGDDYPGEYRGKQVPDKWNFYTSNCTSFAAWCLNTRNKVGFHNYFGRRLWGHAKSWGHTARALGYAVDKNPAVGSIAWWENGDYGHVAWVSAVNGDNVTIEEYNFKYPLRYGERVINKNNPAGYIHIQDMRAPEPEKPKKIEGNYYSDPSLEDGEYIVESVIRNDVVMTVDGNYKNGDNIFVMKNNGWDTQIWKLTRLSDGAFQVLSKGHNRVLDVSEVAIGNKINIHAWEWVDGGNQHWYIMKNSDGTYTFIAKHSGYALDVQDGVLKEAPNYYGNLWQYTPNGTNAQKFRLRKIEPPKKERAKYTVTFKDYDGRTISSQTIEENSSASTPDSPYREGYKFTGWDKEYYNITSNLTIYAKYTKLEEPKKEKAKYTITFKDYDGRTISSQVVEKNSSASTPDSPYREGYQFTGWDKEYYNVTSNLTIYAKYVKLENDNTDTGKSNNKDTGKNKLQKWNSDKYEEEDKAIGEEIGKLDFSLKSLTGLKYSAKVTENQVEEALENLEREEDDGEAGNGTLNLDFTSISSDFKSLTLSMTKEAFEYMVDGDVKLLQISLPKNNIAIDGNALEEIYDSANGKNVTIVIKETLPKAIRKKEKKSGEYKNLYTFDIKVGKKKIKKLSEGNIYTDNPFYKLSKKELKKHLIWFK